MPFQSKSQMKAAFGGYLGKEMQDKAPGWAKETPDPKGLPEHKGKGPDEKGRKPKDKHSDAMKGLKKAHK
jgi:hypothetical protein